MNNNIEAITMEHLRICVEDQPSPDDIQWLNHRLAAFNVGKAGGSDFTPLTIFLRDSSGQLFGGLLGWTVWSWLHIDSLWVEETCRDKDHGSQLLATAEHMACTRGCTLAEVDTLSFQALDFYKKAGYSVFGTLSGIDDRFERYYLSKRLGLSNSPITPAPSSHGNQAIHAIIV